MLLGQGLYLFLLRRMRAKWSVVFVSSLLRSRGWMIGRWGFPCEDAVVVGGIESRFRSTIDCARAEQ